MFPSRYLVSYWAIDNYTKLILSLKNLRFTQIIFYLIPVQLPFYLRSLTNATPRQSGMAIAFCTLFSALAWVSSEVADAMRGRALGGLTTFFFLEQFLSPVVTQPLSQQAGLGVTDSLAGGLLLLLGVAFARLRQQVTALTASPSKAL